MSKYSYLNNCLDTGQEYLDTEELFLSIQKIADLLRDELVYVGALCFAEYQGERSVVEEHVAVECIGLAGLGVSCSSEGGGQTCRFFGIVFGFRIMVGPYAIIPNVGLRTIPYRFEWAHHVS